MKKIIILDFTTGKVFIRSIAKENEDLDAEEIVSLLEDELEIRASDCQYMITAEELIINVG